MNSSNVRLLFLLPLVAIVIWKGCFDSGERAAPKPVVNKAVAPAPSAASVFAKMKTESASGDLKSALQLAKRLVAEFPGTAEATSAASLVPTLEAAIAEAAMAERERAVREAADAEVRRLAAKWHYFASTDPMTSRTSRTAQIESENVVNFDFPYQGAQRATLILRDHPTHGRDVIFQIERGQLLCNSYEGCSVRIRFDEAKAEMWNASPPSDNSSTVLFVRNESRFVQRLRAAKVVRVQVSAYEEGAPTFEFEVGGFDYSRYRQ